MSGHHSPPSTPESGLAEFDDIQGRSVVLKETVKKASDIISAHHRGFTSAEVKKYKKELPEIVTHLRQLIEAQLQPGGGIKTLDLADGSYDNVQTDLALIRQRMALRNLDVDLNRMIGTRTMRKITGFIREDFPDWFSIRWNQAKDNAKQLLKTGALYGGIGAATAVAGYATYGALMPGAGGALAGVGLLGSHLSYVPSAIYNAGATVAGGISYISGKIGGLLGMGGATTASEAVAPAVSGVVAPATTATTSGIWSVGSKIKNFLGW